MADSYTLYAASAFGSLKILPSTVSATFPLFARQMYVILELNNASSILADVATVACIGPVLLVRYARPIRKMSTFARSILQANKKDRGGPHVGIVIRGNVCRLLPNELNYTNDGCSILFVQSICPKNGRYPRLLRSKETTVTLTSFATKKRVVIVIDSGTSVFAV